MSGIRHMSRAFLSSMTNVMFRGGARQRRGVVERRVTKSIDAHAPAASDGLSELSLKGRESDDRAGRPEKLPLKGSASQRPPPYQVPARAKIWQKSGKDLAKIR